jgi:ATP-binding cassette subfamily G (WHITE) protein 2 (SNQ2)
LEFARNKATIAAAARMSRGGEDEEKQGHANTEAVQSAHDGGSKTEKTSLIKNTSVFTWKNLTYTVKVSGGERVLLDKVSGFIKPGSLGALMGSSGAGKVCLPGELFLRSVKLMYLPPRPRSWMSWPKGRQRERLPERFT